MSIMTSSHSDQARNDSSDSEEDLEALLEASSKAFALNSKQRKDEARKMFEQGDDLIQFNQQTSSLPSSKSKGEGRATDDSIDRSTSKAKQDKLEQVELEKHLSRLESGQLTKEGGKKSKKQRQEARAQTAGSGWFDMPAMPTSVKINPGSGSKSQTIQNSNAEEMRREIQAIRLRNALDPKRFYRGGLGTGKEAMPKFAQLGRIVGSNLEPASSLTRQERGRNVVQELVKDAESAAYAKRKFDDVQAKHASGGRGHAKKKQKKGGRR